jgi:hypothetical protein
MFRYRELSEPTRSEEGKGEWVNFPASPDPDPWAALLREANCVPPVVPCDDYRETKRGAAMVTSLAIALRGLLVTTTAVAIVAYLLLTNSHI